MNEVLITKLGLPGRAAQVDEPTFGEGDHGLTVVFEGVTIDGATRHGIIFDLVASCFAFSNLFLDPGNVNFGVEVTDVAHDGIFGHLTNVFAQNDVFVAGRGDEQVGPLWRPRPWW